MKILAYLFCILSVVCGVFFIIFMFASRAFTEIKIIAPLYGSILEGGIFLICMVLTPIISYATSSLTIINLIKNEQFGRAALLGIIAVALSIVSITAYAELTSAIPTDRGSAIGMPNNAYTEATSRIICYSILILSVKDLIFALVGVFAPEVISLGKVFSIILAIANGSLLLASFIIGFNTMLYDGTLLFIVGFIYFALVVIGLILSIRQLTKDTD